MSDSTPSREKIIAQILATFRQYGYEGASLARLSAATGLGRSSLYHHFPKGKEDMAAAALSAVGVWFGENVLSTLTGGGAPEVRLGRFAEKLAEFYRNGSTTCLTDAFTIGEAGALFRQRLGERMRLLMAALARTAEEAGVGPGEAARRAEDAIIGIQGSLIVSRVLGDTAPFLRVIGNLPGQLTART